MSPRSVLLRALALLILSTLFAQAQAEAVGAARWQLTVDGVERSALVFAPATASTTPSPVVFIFHGHGGTALNAARTFATHRYWPEAVCIYMQGLKTPGQITDLEGTRTGWQRRVGDQTDRDLKFFDATLARAGELYKVDHRRIYATGHSNGGSFTYILWDARGETFAAVAPSGAASAASVRSLKPKPAMHIAGEKDPLVKYEWQRRMMNAIRKIDGCLPDGQSWGKFATLYPSELGAPVVEYVHPGGHEFPADAAPLIVKFFKEHPGKERE
jgi:polyhydroxybutyrate depolymerase